MLLLIVISCAQEKSFQNAYKIEDIKHLKSNSNTAQDMYDAWFEQVTAFVDMLRRWDVNLHVYGKCNNIFFLLFLDGHLAWCYGRYSLEVKLFNFFPGIASKNFLVVLVLVVVEVVEEVVVTVVVVLLMVVAVAVAVAVQSTLS